MSSRRKLAKKASANARQDPTRVSSVDLSTPKRRKSKWDTWMWVFLFLIVAFLGGIVAVVIVAVEEFHAELPEHIDVVLYERPNEPLRQSRHLAQIRLVQQHMPWVHQVFVLSPTRSGPDPESQVIYVHFSGTLDEAFEYMADIPNVSNYALFLSDQTMPFREVKKTFLFNGTVPRMFNIFREESEVQFFAPYLETTLPCLATNMVKLKEPPQSWRDLVFREVTEERLTLRNDLNRDIMVVSSMAQNAHAQFQHLVDVPPLFATFHVGPSDPDPNYSYQLLNEFLETV